MTPATAQPYAIPIDPVESSSLAGRGYDLLRQVLAVQFRNGMVLHYGSVPPDLAEEFFEAESAGKFYQSRIRGKFAGERMTGPCEKCGIEGTKDTLCSDCGCGHHRVPPRPAP